MNHLKIVSPDQVNSLVCDAVEPTALDQARIIVEDVKLNGRSALVKHAVKLGDLQDESQSYIIQRDELKKAFDALSHSDQQLIERTAKRIELFARAQRQSIRETEIEVPGGRAGQTVAPMEVAGCYAPGGRYPLPSSVLMTAVTARVAGVKQIWVASPRPVAATLAAAFVAGADGVIAIGGAQAIASMAYGVGGVPACDIIVGPGNKWVTAAKSIVSGRCAIDMLAGPSECLVIADDTADAATIAADLLAQAEHDISAIPILVTTSKSIITSVNEELSRQLETLPTGETAKVSVSKVVTSFIVSYATRHQQRLKY